MTKSDKVLVILFRYLLGIGSLFALVPVVMPWSWCDSLVCASHCSALSSRASIWQQGCPCGGRPWRGQGQCLLGRWFTFSPAPFMEQIAPRITRRTPITNDLDTAPCRKVLRHSGPTRTMSEFFHTVPARLAPHR